jgi:hypothetical protein
LTWLLLRGSSGVARAILEEPQFVAFLKQLQLLYFLLKKKFGRALLKEIEPESKRRPTKHALEHLRTV